MVIRNACNPTLLAVLADAVEQLLDRAVAGDPDAEMRWIDRERRIPDLVSDVLSARKYHPSFGELFESVILPFVESLLGLKVRCSWLSLFVFGGGYRYATALHRDNNIVGSGESELLAEYEMRQCYFQVPLLPYDQFLQVVPGSHLRPANAAEINASTGDWDGADFPGMVTIEPQPDDIVYRHTNMIHRGCNPDGKPRRVLISGLWAETLPLLELEKRDYAAGNHPEFLAGLPPRFKSSVQRFIAAWRQAEI